MIGFICVLCSWLCPSPPSALLHVLTIVFDRHRHDFLVREHEANAFQLHRDLVIVAEVGMNISIDVLLLLEDCIVSGNDYGKVDHIDKGEDERKNYES